MLYKTLTFVGVVLSATLATARADTASDPEAPPTPAASAPAGGVDQLTLPRGQLLLDAFAEINLSSGAVFIRASGSTSGTSSRPATSRGRPTAASTRAPSI